jgi:predicted TIM-barrel fold metal-dependent hydrolase
MFVYSGNSSSTRDKRFPGESDAMEVVELARRFPEAMIIMAHFNLGDWEYGIKAVKSTPNIYPCTSGSGIDADSTEMAVGEVGAERVIFGTDNSIYASLGKIYGAHISDRDRRLIFGENLLRLLTKRGPLS